MTRHRTHIGIAGRLYLMTALLSGAMLLVAGAAWVNLREVSSSAVQAGSERVGQLQRMAELELNVTRVSLQLRHAMLSRTPQEQAASLNDVKALRQRIEQALSDYQQHLFSDGGKQRFASIPPKFTQFWAVGTENLQLIQAGQKEAAFAYLVDRTIPARNELLAVLNDSVRFQEAALQADIGQIGDRSRFTLYTLLALVGAAMLGLLALSMHIASALRSGVHQSQALAVRVRDGDLSVGSGHEQRSDEFGPLIHAMHDMQAALARIVHGVRGSAENVATASAQIAQGNQDLSGRTEQQASALQLSLIHI